VVGGVEALVMRFQLLWPESKAVPPDVFNQMMTMHGTTMIFFAAMPILAGVANYIIPLQIGARDMAFPRLNAFGFWATLFDGILGPGAASLCHASAHGSPDHDLLRPESRRPFFRRSARRLAILMAAFVLVFWPSRSLHPGVTGLRHRLRRAAGFLAQSDLRL